MNRIMNKKKFFAPSAWRLEGAANPLPCRGGAGVGSVTLLRRAATALLLCVMTMTVQTAWAQSGNWSDYKAASFSSINESAKTISITSEAELALLAYNTCNGTDYSGYTITLTKDLSMSAHYWDKTIGNSEDHSFKGTFNGANKTISGININSGDYYKGLFGFVGRSGLPGTIQNVTLASSTITGKTYVGGIVGNLLNGTVSNCHVLSSVSILASSDNSLYFGGIVGRTYPQRTNTNATIENCTSAALVTDNGHNNCSNYGGIVGYNYYYSDTYFSKVTGCFYYGTAVSASSEAGAIVGLNYKADGTGISNCYYNYPSTISGIGYGNTDNGTTRVYTVTCTTSGLSTTGTATYTHNGKYYFAAGATATVSAPSQKIYALEATTGSISNVNIADDRHSATFTIGSGDVTLALSYSGTTSDGLTWSLSGTNHTELTISGNGAMKNYYRKTVNSLWRTDAPWGYDITSVTVGNGVTSIGDYAFCGCQSLASVTLGSGVTSIGYAAINHCDAMTEITLPAATTTIGTGAFANSTGLQRVNIGHDGAVTLADNGTFSGCNALQYIVFPSPAGALANTTGNWSGLTDKLRAQFGSQLFTVTTEGGTAAYAITNEQDLRNLATAVNAGNNGSVKTFRQTADITMSSTNFTTIGKNDNNYFSGTYDGGEKAIIGLTVNVTDNCFAGLFGCVSYGGKVKKLYLISPNANCSYSAGDSRVVGAVVGSLEHNSTIEDCYVVNPKVTTPSGSGYLGVICGVSNSGENTITNCYFYDNNTSHKYKALGLSYGTITNVGRAYTIAATSPVTASATKAFTYDGTDYYVEGSTVTLSGGTPHTNGGWVDTYTVNSTAIEGNTFSLTADATVGYSSTPDATHFAETADNEYIIYDATGWSVFCDLLAENNQGFFTGKTVVLDKDIAVTRMAGSTNHEFSGTFDGQTHTLTVAITGTVQGTAPFCEIKGATIRNLAVTGSVAGMRHSAGLVGFARGDNSVTNIIENCLVNTSVSITGDTNGYLGGIVGHGFTSALTIRGCAFTGSLTSTSNYTGGLQGWSDGNILTLQNDLFAPTSVSAANAGFHPVAFHNNNSTTTATVSNVYYTEAPTCTQATRIATANAAEQPKQARSIEAGENVTVANAGTATQYDVSHITAYGTGIKYGEVLYAGSGDAVSLTLTNTPPTGYAFNGYTASPDGTTLTGSANPYTLTMPDANVTITATFALLPAVSYIDGNGVEQFKQPGEYTVLTSDMNVSNLSSGWYVITNSNPDPDNNGGVDVSFTSCILGDSGTGTINFILCDDSEMTINVSDNSAIYTNGNHALTIYGQQNGTGRLTVSTNRSGIRSYYGDITINGGIISATKTENGAGIDTYSGNIIINGGTVTANSKVNDNVSSGISNDKGTISIRSGKVTASSISGNVTLGWTSATDFIKANSYNGTVNIASGKAFTTDGTDIYSGSGVTGIDGKTLTPAVAVTLADGITATGGVITSGDDNYAKVGATVTVSTSGVSVPEGYTLGGITVTPAVTVTDQGSGSYSFTVPAANVSVSAQFVLAGSIAYIDENGVKNYKQPGEFTVLTGTETSLGSSGQETWYVVNSDITYDATIRLYGSTTIILCNGCTMSIGEDADGKRINGMGIYGDDNYALTIYGQSLDDATAGHLKIFTTGNNISNCISYSPYTQHSGNVTVKATGDWAIMSYGDITVNGGTLSATSLTNEAVFAHNGGSIIINGGKVNATSSTYSALWSWSRDVTINGGQVEATGGSYGIYAGEGTITLGWTNASDYIKASRYEGTVTIASGKTLYDEDGTPYSGTIEKVNGAFPIDGKTLRPLTNVLVLNDDADNTAAIAAAAVPGASPSGTNVILQGRKLWKDGAWNTLVLPFSIANIEADGCPLKGATVRELDDASITGTTLTLNFKNATTAIAAGVPYIVKWADGTAGQYTQDPVFQGVTIDATTHSYDNQAGGDTNVRFIGTYDQKTVNTEDQSILFLGAANTLYYPSGQSATTIGACRAYFKIGSGDAANARQLTAFNFAFGDETNAVFDLNNKEEITNNNWYSLNGVKLDGKPTKKGLYIHGGRKVVVP